MTNINNQLVRLSDDDRQAIYYAFENEQPYYVVLKDSTFIGVNLTIEPQLIIELTQGLWSIGRLK